MDRAEQAAITALQHGDIGGLETLVRRHQLRALRAAYAITGDHMAAEDVVADAFLAAYERIAQFESGRLFAPWFFRIVANRAVDVLRKARPTTTGAAAESFLTDLASPAPGPEGEALRQETHDRVVRAIGELPPAQRAVLVRRYYLDWEETAIARATGTPVGTVKSRLWAAKKKLRASLDELRPGVPAGRTEEQRAVRGALATHVEAAIPADSSVWPALRRRLPFLLRTFAHPHRPTLGPLASGEAPPAPPDFSAPPPDGSYLLVGTPRSGTPVSLEEAERLADFAVLVLTAPEWRLATVAYCPAEAQRATQFDPPRYAWHMPAVTLRYQAPAVTATVVEHRNVYPTEATRVMQAAEAAPGDPRVQIEPDGDAAYLVRAQPEDGLVQEVQLATPTTRVFVTFDPATTRSTAGAFVRGLQPTERSLAMEFSRRTFLGTASGLAVIAVAGCAAPPLPGARRSAPPARVAALRAGNVTNTGTRRLQEVLGQSVGALATAHRVPIDPQIIWIALPEGTPVPDGQMPTTGVVEVLGQMLGPGNASPRPDLVALADSFVLQTSGLAQAIGPDVQIRQLAAQQLLRPLDEFLRTTPSVKLDDYFPGALEACRVDGKLYALPLSFSVTMLLYDQELFDAAGVTVADGGWNWQQLVEAGRKLAQPPKQYALAPATLDVGVFVEQNGGAILSADGRRCLLDQPAALEAAAFYASLFRARSIVAPPPDDRVDIGRGMLTVDGVRIAMLPSFTTNSPPVETGAPPRLHLAESIHGATRRADLALQGALVMTRTVTEPASAFATMVALAGDLQQRLFVPATQAAAKTVDPRQQGLSLDAAEQAAILRTAQYATYGAPLGPDLTAPVRALDIALREGQDPKQACQAATDAINTVLRGGVGAPGPA